MRAFSTRGYSAASLDELATATRHEPAYAFMRALAVSMISISRALQRYREQSREATISLLADRAQPCVSFCARFYAGCDHMYFGGGER